MTTTKKCLKNATGTQKKRSHETDYQDDDEIIDIDEVRKRNGITGEKKHYFIACLRTYYEDDEFICYRLIQNESSPFSLSIDYNYNQ